MSVNSDTLLSKIELVSTKLVTIKMLEIILGVKSLQDSICGEEYLYHRDMSCLMSIITSSVQETRGIEERAMEPSICRCQG